MALSDIIISYHKTPQVDGQTEKKNQLSVLSDWCESQVLSGFGRMPVCKFRLIHFWVIFAL
jgi:hypothetical protein